MTTNQHESILQYLELVENTESPRLFHVWAMLAGMSACMERRCWLPFGHTQVWPNNYIVLSGPPAVRKSTALNIVTKFLKQNTSVRLAPTDTAGQKQGLISHLIEDGDDEEEAEDALKNLERAWAQGDTDSILAGIKLPTATPKDRAHTSFVAASEFNSFLGLGSSSLTTMLIKLYDGEEYEYRLKKSKEVIRNGLLGILAATTPTNMADALPAESSGQGFLSRLVLVYSAEQYKSIPWPEPFDAKLEAAVAKLFINAHNLTGKFSVTPEAHDRCAQLYNAPVNLDDHRFTHYANRRYTHLLKTAMALAASRGSLEITIGDLDTAHSLLAFTERSMPEALGLFGMSPLSKAKQQLHEYLEQIQTFIPYDGLWAHMHTAMSLVDFNQIIQDLHTAGKIVVSTAIVNNVSTNIIAPVRVAKQKQIAATTDPIVDLLAAKKPAEPLRVIK